MKAKRRTGYGVYDISRQVARRVQKEWETVESPPLAPKLRFLMEATPAEPVEEKPPREKHPLAA